MTIDKNTLALIRKSLNEKKIIAQIKHIYAISLKKNFLVPQVGLLPFDALPHPGVMYTIRDSHFRVAVFPRTMDIRHLLVFQRDIIGIAGTHQFDKHRQAFKENEKQHNERD